MADKPKTSGLDYGHRTYMTADDYTSAMARASDKAIDNRFKRPHSDDKKPYYNDEYPEMEYHWTPYDPPNFIPPGIPDDPRIVLPPSYPGSGGSPGGPTGQSDFTGCVFTVPVGNKFINYEEITFSGIGLVLDFGRDVGRPDEFYVVADPLVSLAVEFGPIKILTKVATVNRLAVSFYTPMVLVEALTEQEIEDGDYQLDGDYYPSQIVATTKSGGQCWFAVWVIKCPPTVEFEWDTENSPETIVQDGQATVYVTGGVSPFTWTVSGTGYTLSAQKTSGRANTLIASESACGTATITCTDECDTQVEGTLRNVTAGKWGPTQSPFCGLAGVQCNPLPYNNYYGNYGYIEMYATSGGGKQMHRHYYDLYGMAYYTDGGSLEANIANCIADQTCGGAFDTGCLEFPEKTYCNNMWFTRCGASNIFYWPCEASGYSNWARGNKIVFRSLPSALWYWDWICP